MMIYPDHMSLHQVARDVVIMAVVILEDGALAQGADFLVGVDEVVEYIA